MRHVRVQPVFLAIAAAAVLAGCGSSGTKLTSPTGTGTSAGTTEPATSAPTATIATNYNPKIDPAQFTDAVTNKYLPMAPGLTHEYTGVRDGVPTHHKFTVTRQSKIVMGVKCLVIQDVVTQNQSLVEKTTDWYAQDAAGNVWYFGEDTAEYENGVVVSTAGTWEAGVDKAQPGIVMPATPRVGDSYRQEYRPGVALDIATIESITGTARVPAGTYHQVVVTLDKNPLDPSKIEHKMYAEGVGFVRAVLKGGGHTETTELVR